MAKFEFRLDRGESVETEQMTIPDSWLSEGSAAHVAARARGWDGEGDPLSFFLRSMTPHLVSVIIEANQAINRGTINAVTEQQIRSAVEGVN